MLASRIITDPLTRLQCCPSQVDGAEAGVLSTRRRGAGKPVKVLSFVVVSGIREHARDDILDAESARGAPGLRASFIGPDAVDVVELRCVHDRQAAALRSAVAGAARRRSSAAEGVAQRHGAAVDLGDSPLGGARHAAFRRPVRRMPRTHGLAG